MAFESLSDKLSAAFKKLRGKGRLTAADVKEAMKEVRMALLEADVSYKVVKEFTKSVTERASGADVLEALSPAQMVVKIVNEELVKLMGSENQRLTIGSKSPSVVMLVGLQGAGKTTNGAKLAAYMRKQGKRPLLAACDIYRPAAIKQLETVGKQLDIPVFQMGTTNPVDIAKAAVEHAKKHGNDLVFLDTAGRLHIDEALMDELNYTILALGDVEFNGLGMSTNDLARQITKAGFSSDYSKSVAEDIYSSVTAGAGTFLSYGYGMVAMLNLRDEAEAQLGDSFDVVAYHEAVLDSGNEPLDMLQDRMADWIRGQKYSQVA